VVICKNHSGTQCQRTKKEGKSQKEKGPEAKRQGKKVERGIQGEIGEGGGYDRAGYRDWKRSSRYQKLKTKSGTGVMIY